MDLALFRARRLLDVLAVASVGTAQAAVTAAIFGRMLDGATPSIALITGLPTLALGSLWAVLMRWRATLRRSRVRVGWLLAAPLAALNAALAGGILVAVDAQVHRFFSFVGGMVLGVTVGAMFWIPGLVLTLLVFGVPIARAQRLAAEGLAGQERGDGFIGAASAAIAAAALASAVGATHHNLEAAALAGLALAVGLATLGVARWREGLRRAFVAAVEAGRVEHFRVDATAAGKVLVRVVSQGAGYRVADYAEEVAALDAQGAVTRGGGGDS